MECGKSKKLSVAPFFFPTLPLLPSPLPSKQCKSFGLIKEKFVVKAISRNKENTSQSFFFLVPFLFQPFFSSG